LSRPSAACRAHSPAVELMSQSWHYCSVAQPTDLIIVDALQSGTYRPLVGAPTVVSEKSCRLCHGGGQLRPEAVCHGRHEWIVVGN
jgi:hypothetical protein